MSQPGVRGGSLSAPGRGVQHSPGLDPPQASGCHALRPADTEPGALAPAPGVPGPHAAQPHEGCPGRSPARPCGCLSCPRRCCPPADPAAGLPPKPGQSLRRTNRAEAERTGCLGAGLLVASRGQVPEQAARLSAHRAGQAKGTNTLSSENQKERVGRKAVFEEKW